MILDGHLLVESLPRPNDSYPRLVKDSSGCPSCFVEEASLFARYSNVLIVLKQLTRSLSLITLFTCYQINQWGGSK